MPHTFLHLNTKLRTCDVHTSLEALLPLDQRQSVVIGDAMNIKVQLHLKKPGLWVVTAESS